MPIQVVTGAPFSGKGRFVRSEIERREADGELGLLALDWTALYTALIPGTQSAFRDDAVGRTGAPRMAGYTFEVVTAAAVARELDGYILTQSPRKAIELADRFPSVALFEVPADPGDIATRVETHLRTLGRTVARAATSGALGRCRKGVLTYERESPALVGRARVVRPSSSGGWQVGEVKRPFDRALWQRGLTPKGHEALAELVSLGNPEPSPSDVLQFLLKNKVEG